VTGGTRSILWLALLALPGGAAAQGTVTIRRFPGTVPGAWLLSIAVGRPIGGPTGQMKDRLLAEGWTEHFCDVWKANCHDNPLIGAPRFAFAGTLARRLSHRFEVGTTVSTASLGSAEGRQSGTDVKADWSVSTAAVSLVFSPLPRFRAGAGPLIAFLNSQTTGDTPRTVARGGVLFEVGFRSSAAGASFLDFSLAYRLIGKRMEGPWPGLRRGFAAPAGPSPLDADFSHFSLSLGVGWRLSS
jgi:hypothetical protein